jgi:hypothetical protein
LDFKRGSRAPPEKSSWIYQIGFATHRVEATIWCSLCAQIRSSGEGDLHNGQARMDNSTSLYSLFG